MNVYSNFLVASLQIRKFLSYLERSSNCVFRNGHDLTMQTSRLFVFPKTSKLNIVFRMYLRREFAMGFSQNPYNNLLLNKKKWWNELRMKTVSEQNKNKTKLSQRDVQTLCERINNAKQLKTTENFRQKCFQFE